MPAPKGSDPLHQRFRDDTRVIAQPQELAVQEPPRALTSYTLTLSNSVTLPASRKRRRSGSDPGMPSGSDSQWSSDGLMRPAGLEANVVRDLVNCARFSCHLFLLWFVRLIRNSACPSVFHTLPSGPNDYPQADFHGCSKPKQGCLTSYLGHVRDVRPFLPIAAGQVPASPARWNQVL